MIRPQDLAVKGVGKLVYNKESRFVLNGQGTQFTQQASPRDIIALSKTLSFEVAEVVSDTELRLKKELTDEAVELLHDGGAYKIIPHIDQSVLFEKVHDRLNAGECIVIFPEGGSHDRSEMLPLKGLFFYINLPHSYSLRSLAGFAIMALGAMAQNKDLDVKIVPVGIVSFSFYKASFFFLISILSLFSL